MVTTSKKYYIIKKHYFTETEKDFAAFVSTSANYY